LTLINRRTDIADVLAKLLDKRLTCHFVLLKLGGGAQTCLLRHERRAFFLK
jgi:hypothetical protein